MNQEHVISDALIESAQQAFAKGENWVAYNTISYFLDKGEVYFFKTSDEAHEFSESNISEYDDYRVMHALSVHELFMRIPYGEELEKKLNNLKIMSTMNEQNFDYLKDNIKYLGFGEKQHEELEKNLKEQKESFQMTFATEVNKKPFEATLNFRKSESSDMYFLNDYKATLERMNGEKMEQMFYLNKGKGVTAKEAYNLLEGRAVHKELTNKEGESYKAWIQLDFDKKDTNQNFEVKQYHENYGFDLKSSLSKYEISELDGAEKENALLHSLEKGNLQSVTVGTDGEAQRMFIEANPQYKTINIFNDKFQRLSQDERLGLMENQARKDLKEGKVINEKNQQEISPDKKKSAKQKVEDEPGQTKKKKTRKRGISA